MYVYDSYVTPAKEWSRVLGPTGPLSVRGTAVDAFVVGLLVRRRDINDLKVAHFDGWYSYFATDGFTEGSTTARWGEIERAARREGKVFVPAVGPGYADMRIRPWNGANQRDREGGEYFRRMWERARALGGDFISVTSYNEWHEGTSIEPAAADKTITVSAANLETEEDFEPYEFSYKTYGDNPRLYLDLLYEFVNGLGRPRVPSGS